MAAALAEPISPELVLVSPELRERALASLPSLDPEALFRIPAYERRLVLVPPAPPRPPFVLGVLAYLAEALFLGAVRGAALVAVIAIAAFVLAR